MSSLFKTSVTELTGITAAWSNSNEWDFQGITISTKHYSGDIDADLAAVSTEANLDHATVKGGQYKKTADVSARPSSFGHRLSGSTCVESSYADTEASMNPNYSAPSYESMLQYSTFVPTPTTSVDEHRDDKSFSGQNDLVEQQQQPVHSDFPICTSGPTPLDSWYDKPERHEQIAYKLSDPATDPMAQKEIKKTVGKKVQKRK